ncbi:glycoside hydrolase family 43 protein [Croceibacterium mercuriale]|uniref:glycoside hydrolase family 43 protein n=1 Tax=Croceibacterium mercuriale TaxID=1572751 RepID=UPI0009DE9914|nr:glycoside hydrolase family 43 protein [Croceibacterium mercuriale]
MRQPRPVPRLHKAVHRSAIAVLLALLLPGCLHTPPAAPVAAAPSAEMVAYLFVYFTGSGLEKEAIHFAVSEGNDALHWRPLNDGRPVLQSTKGTLGLRDPFILRSAQGDRFFLLATDLSAARTGWDDATSRGSHHLEIWESTDLVHWGEQRHVQVNLPQAGMTWAPEATWDPARGVYVVYWASTLFTDDARTQGDGHGAQMLFASTRDFHTFSPPQPWFKAADRPELTPDKGLIDATVLHEGNTFFRFTKATEASGCPSGDIILDRSTDLGAGGNRWLLADRCIGQDAGTTEVEGPAILRTNPGDRSGYRYILFVDRFRDIGLVPLATQSLEGDIRWTTPASFALPAGARHGTVLPISAAERDALLARWGAK